MDTVIMFLTLGLILVLGVEITGAENEAEFVGCFRDPANTRMYRTSPSGYALTEINAMKCASICGAINNMYAAMTQGKYCFCGDKPPQEDRRENGSCTWPCPTLPEFECGSKTHSSVYKTLDPVRSLTVTTDARDVIRVNDPANFHLTADAVSLDSLMYQLELGDGRGRTDKSNATTYDSRFMHPGKYIIHAFVSDENDYLHEKTDIISVTVDAQVEELSIDCDPVFGTDIFGKCRVTIWAGAGLNMQYIVNGVDTSQIFSIPDPVYKFFGHGVPRTGEDIQAPIDGNGIYLMPSSRIDVNGVILGWEYYANATGTVQFLILEPCIGSYCYKTNLCSGTCLGPEKVSCTAISGNPVLCTWKELCTTLAADVSCPTANPYIDITALPYTVKHAISIEVTNVGFAYYKMHNFTKMVAPGDIVGVTGSIIGVLPEDSPIQADDYSFEHSCCNVAEGATTTMYAGTSIHHLLRVVISQGSFADVLLKFPDRGNRSLDVFVSNVRPPGNESIQSEVVCIESINEIVLEAAMYAETGVNTSFQILPHEGDFVTYEYNFGDGDTTVTAVQTTWHVFSKIGIYNVSVVATNAVSSNDNSTMVIVEARVGGLWINSSASITNETALVQFSLTAGSDYICIWNHGDSSTNITFESDLNVSGDTYMHVYSQAGIYTLTVNCSNNISSEQATILHTVQNSITGLQFVNQGANIGTQFYLNWNLTSGTAPFFSLLFNSHSIPNQFNNITNTGTTTVLLGPFSSPQIIYNVSLSANNLVSNVQIFMDFLIDEKMENVSTTASVSMIATKSLVYFDISMSKGAGVSVTIDFDDGSNLTTSDPPGLAFNGSKTFPHNFTLAKTHQVVITVFNAIDSYVFSHSVQVLQRIENIQLLTNAELHEPLLLKPPADCIFFFAISSGQAPNGASMEIDFGDKITLTTTYESVKNYTHQYIKDGLFDMQVNISNAVSFQYINKTVKVLEKIVSCHFELDSTSIPLGVEITVTLKCFRGPTGTDLIIDWDLDEGNPAGIYKKESRKGFGENGQDTKNYTYTACSSGGHLIQANLTSAAEFVVVSKVVECLCPVIKSNFLLTSEASLLNGLYILPKKNPTKIERIDGNPPTDAKVTVDFNNGTIETLPLADPTYVYPEYNSIGKQLIKITIWNSASSETWNHDAGFYVTASSITVQPRYKDILPVIGSDFPPIETTPDIVLPTRYLARFHFNISSGTAVWYRMAAVIMYPTWQVDFICTGLLYPCTQETNPFQMIFTEPGLYNMTFQAGNPVSDSSTSILVRLIHIVKNLKINTITANQFSISIEIVLESFGPNTVLTIDFDDGSTDKINVTSKSFSVDHVYTNYGEYTVMANASDAVSFSSDTYDIPISQHNCLPPTVDIKDKVNLCLNAPEYLKSKPFRVVGITKINCSSTLENTKKWILEEVDVNDCKPIRNIDISTILSHNKSELGISKRFLNYGVYKATYLLTMDKATLGYDYMSSQYTFIKIISSDIITAISTVTKMKVGLSDQMITLSPEKHSYDPDMDPTENQGFTNFIWFCKKADEPQITTDASGFWQISNVSEPLTAVEIPRDVDEGGCFQQGPGMIDMSKQASVGELTFYSGNFHPNTTYEFHVIGKKGMRSAVSLLYIETEVGSAPIVNIRCGQGRLCKRDSDGITISPTQRLSLITECQFDCYGDMKYSWEVFEYNYRFSPPWYRLDNLIDHVNGSYGLNSDSLAIEKDFWKHHSDVEKFLVQLTVESSSSLIKGISSIVLHVNMPPKNGKCTIDKVNGVAGDVFSVECLGWTDDSGIESLEFYCKFLNDNVERFQGFGTVTHYSFQLPSGPSWNDFHEDLYVRVTDNMGSSVEEKIATMRVVEASKNETDNLIETLQGGMSSLALASAEANINEFVNFAIYVTSALNTASVQDQTGYEGIANVAAHRTPTGFGPNHNNRIGAFNETVPNEEIRVKYELERDKRGKIRCDTNQASASMPLTSINHITMVTNVVANNMEYPEECSRQCQAAGAEAIVNSAKALKEFAADTTFEEALHCVENILESAVQLNNAGKYHTETPMIQEKKSAEEFQDYDVALFSTQKRIKSNDRELGDEELLIITNEELQHKLSNDRELGDEELLIITNEELQHKLLDKIHVEMKETMTTVLEVLDDFMIEGETADIQTNNIILKKIKNKANLLANQKIKLADASVDFPENHCNLFSDVESCNDTESMSINAAIISSPYKLYIPGGSNVSPYSRGISLDVTRNNQPVAIKNSTKPIVFSVPKDPFTPSDEAVEIFADIPDNNDLFYHKFTLTRENRALFIQLTLEPNVSALVFVRCGDFPNIGDRAWDYFTTVPQNNSTNGDPYTFFVPPEIVKNFTGPVYVGARQMNSSENYADESEIPLSFPPRTGQFTGNYSLKTMSGGCYYLDEKENKWSSEGCTVGPESSYLSIQCLCTHMTSFSGGWMVVPNTIDWDFVFSNMDFFQNPTLYVTEIVIALIYILAVIWARREDKKDVEKLGLIPLADNNSQDKYFYEIIVVTGMRRNAATKSKVYFVLSGEYEETDVRELSDDHRSILNRGSVDSFLMTTPRPLGPLNYLRIWHDNSGKGKFGSWYLNYILIRDVKTNEKFFFINNQWLAVEEGDGQVDRIIPVAGTLQVKEFSHLFPEKARQKLTDGHIWFSVIARPPASRFTRVQRVSCCLCMLFLTMLANAMYYGKDTSSGSQAFAFGPFSLTPDEVFIGIMTNLIVFPPSFLLIILFRKTKLRQKRPSRVMEALKKISPDSARSVVDVKPILKSSCNVRNEDVSPDDPYRPDTSLSVISQTNKDLGPHTISTTKPTKLKKKKRFQLPWWMLIVSWILLWALVLMSAFFVTAYGISFKDGKCRMWITSMIIAFITSIFITQPIKVFFMAIFLSLIIKNPGEESDDMEEDEEEVNNLQDDEEYIRNSPNDKRKPRSSAIQPPDEFLLEEARVKRCKEIKMWAIIREVLFYFFFLWTLMIISYKNRSLNSYYFKQNLEKVFHATRNGRLDKPFDEIRDRNQFWSWMQKSLIPGILAQKYYNGDQPIYLRGLINDKTSRLMGYGVLRQLRLKPGTCRIGDSVRQFLATECNEGYTFNNEDRGTYGEGWKTLLSNETELEHYHYQTDKTLNGFPYWGLQHVYGGGGYVFELKHSVKVNQQKLKQLEEEDWINKYTRALFIEFTVYNPEINMFGICLFLAEVLPSNSFLTSYRLEPAVLLPYSSGNTIFQLICEILFLIYTIVFIVREIIEISKKKLTYFSEFWNFIELSIIGTSIFGIVIYFYNMLETSRLLKYFVETHGNAYMKFQFVGYWNEMFSYAVGWLTFLATIKFMKLLRFNKKMSLLGSTLRSGARPLIQFSIIFGIVFMAFIQLLYLTYACTLYTFSTFMSAMASGIFMIMGKFDIYEMLSIEPYFTPLFLFLFLVTNTFILVNMFMALLNETFASVRSDISKQGNDYEIVDFMLNRFKMWTGIGSLTLEKNSTADENKEERHINNHERITKVFPKKVDQLLLKISYIYFDNPEYDEILRQCDAIKVKNAKLSACGPDRNTQSFSNIAPEMTKIDTN